MRAKLKLIASFICILLLWLCTSLTPANAYETTVYLEDIDSATTISPGNFRWLDVANHQFNGTFIDNYDYTQAEVTVTYEIIDDRFQGTLTATNLKPNFAYQVNLPAASRGASLAQLDFKLRRLLPEASAYGG